MTHERYRARWLSGTTWFVALLGLTGAASAAPPATKPTEAAPRAIEGRVLSAEGGELIVDVAAATGAQVGDRLELWRPIELRHPVTQKLVRDRFMLGHVVLVQVRERLALAHAADEGASRAQRGDVVVLAGVRSTSVPSVTAPPSTPGAESDPEAAAVTRLFDSLRGKSLEERAAAYEAEGQRAPSSRFATQLLEDAQAFRRASARRSRGEASAGPAPITAPRARSFDAPSYAVAGRPLSFGVELERADRGAVLYVRSKTQPSYVAHRLRASGARYWVTTLPAASLEAGELQYFVEASDEAGRPVPVVGSQDAPLGVRVEAPPSVAPPARPPAVARLFTDYADYNRLRGNDWAWQTEGDVGARFGDLRTRAVRAGFGVFRGQGGSVAELDELRLAPRSVGLTYGYLEYEYGISRITSVIGRGAVGLGDDGATGGAQIAFRLGSDLSTNVVIGGEVLGGVGLRGITELNLAVVERFPITFRTEVTNQPAGTNASGPYDPTRSSAESDVGLRVLAQIGFKATPSLTLAARGSYQGRNIEHAGPGFGGGVTYSW